MRAVPGCRAGGAAPKTVVSGEEKAEVIRVTGAQLARHFEVHPSTIRRWVAAGCPVLELGSVGRGHGASFHIPAVEQWRIRQTVPTAIHRSDQETLDVVTTALLDTLKRDDLAKRAKITGMQAALVVLLIFERVYRNIKQQPLERQEVPEEMRHLCAIYLNSVEEAG